MRKPTKIPMTFEEFEVYDVPFGWKDEYWNGHAHITPRPYGVLMKIKVEKRKVNSDAKIVPISEISRDELNELFFQTFFDSVEYLNRTKKEVRSEAKKEIKNFFDGRRGVPQLEFCKIASVDGKKIGACLISKYKYGYKNEIIFVHPDFQSRKIGSAMLASVINDLQKIGEKFLWSEHHICNEKSADWHHKFGFKEVTDIMTAKFRLNYYRQQIYRSEKLNDAENLKIMKPLFDKAKREVERLKKIEKDDFDAAWMTWRYDY